MQISHYPMKSEFLLDLELSYQHVKKRLACRFQYIMAVCSHSFQWSLQWIISSVIAFSEYGQSQLSMRLSMKLTVNHHFSHSFQSCQLSVEAFGESCQLSLVTFSEWCQPSTAPFSEWCQQSMAAFSEMGIVTVHREVSLSYYNPSVSLCWVCT